MIETKDTQTNGTHITEHWSSKKKKNPKEKNGQGAERKMKESSFFQM